MTIELFHKVTFSNKAEETTHIVSTKQDEECFQY